jgi:hypothetical protein
LTDKYVRRCHSRSAQDIDDFGRYDRSVDQLLNGEIPFTLGEARFTAFYECGADCLVEGHMIANFACFITRRCQRKCLG